MKEHFIGIDISKDYLDIADSATQETWRTANDDSGIASLTKRLSTPTPTLIVLEATGGLEISLASALAAKGLPVTVVNPRQVRDFAKATGQLAKTDTLDAKVLVHFARAVRPEIRQIKDQETRELAANRRPDRTRSPQSRQRIVPRSPMHLGRTSQCPGNLVHGRCHRNAT